MTASLADCHTFFLVPVASDSLIDARAGKGTVGIGVELASIPPFVTEVITGGPAAHAGLLVGDRIAAVDGADTLALGPQSTLNLLNGDEGTMVRVRVQRPGAAEAIERTIARERVTPPNVDARLLDQGVGYVRVRNFVDDGVVAPLRAALQGLEAQGSTGWIIDLRGNPGGRLDPEAISLFVGQGVIARDRGRGGAVHEERAIPAETLPVLPPTVLLTNNRTGSVAEVFAAALQEHGVATVMGGTTNGCAGYTDIRAFGDGSSMAVTTHVNLGPISNAELNGVGVVPDIAVARTEADIAAGRDPQLAAAIAHLLRQ
jgi:carboxyl-terminal processing protease